MITRLQDWLFCNITCNRRKWFGWRCKVQKVHGFKKQKQLQQAMLA